MVPQERGLKINAEVWPIVQLGGSVCAVQWLPFDDRPALPSVSEGGALDVQRDPKRVTFPSGAILANWKLVGYY